MMTSPMNSSAVQKPARSTTWLSALLLAGSLAITAPVVATAAPQAGGSGSNTSSGSSGPSGSGSASGQPGSSSAGGKPAATGASTGSAATGGPEKILQVAVPPCSTCHQVKAGVNQPGPSLAGVATRARQRIAAKDYKGKAKDAKSYIRESIMDPNAYLVPGPAYAANGKSLMPATYAQTLKPEQIDQIVSYLMTLK